MLYSIHLFVARVLLTAIICALVALQSSGRTYYVDCASGNDAADGLSQRGAWKSVSAVSERPFRPGDSILFRRGTTCTGMLWPKGSGSAAAAIRLDAWGTGPLPRIRAAAGQEMAFRLSDQEYWTIEHLEFTGGQPYGVLIDGTRGVLHSIHIRDSIVHDVTGQPKRKESGLLVISPGSREQKFDDVIVDGVTAYGTSQWAGILVGGANLGVLTESARSTNVTVRNSIVHDVAGDGIVLFQVNRGTIENSVAWHTGMQETETIGTPNAIWTWMCRDCVVRRSEAYLTDSPGVDGGAFDIDYGNDNNTVEESYGHDTQGYCAAIFGAERVTTNSVIRNNVCSNNGRSPRLAKRQGAVFLSTWNGGKLKGVRIDGNKIFWNPPLATAAVVNDADFDGSGVFENNTIRSTSPVLIRSNSSLVFKGNDYWGRSGEGFEWAGKPFGELEFLRSLRGKWVLVAFVSALPEDPGSRGQVAIIESAYRQFHSVALEAMIVPFGVASEEEKHNLRYDWNTSALHFWLDGRTTGELNVPRLPSVALINPDGNIIWQHDGFTTPSELGLTLRLFLGNPDYAQMETEP